MRVVRLRSLPHVDDDRLLDSLQQLCSLLHGVDAMRRFDMPRRSLVDNGLKVRPILRELLRRGTPVPTGSCRICNRALQQVESE